MKRLLGLFLCAASPAWATGGEVGNGGQRVAMEFTTYAYSALGLLQRQFGPGAAICADLSFGALCELNLEQLRGAIQIARVIAMPELTQMDPNSGETLRYVAINYPQEQRVLVSESEWDNPSLCYVKKLPIVFHEYLGIMGVEIGNYRYSSLLAAWLNENASPDKFQGCPEL